MTPYYSHSGKFSPDAPFVALAIGIPAAIVLSWLYAYAILYIPVIGIVTFLLTGGLAALTGAVTGAVLKWRKVRSHALAWGLGLFIGTTTLYFSWVTWIVGVLRRADDATDVSWLGLAISPDVLWNVITKVNEVGAWSFKGATPTGGLLWAFWAGEALIIVGLTAIVANALVSQPYCETCGVWTEERKGIATTALTEIQSLREQLEQKRFDALTAVGPITEPHEFLRYDFHACASCLETNTLSVVQVKVTEKKGKLESSDTTLIEDLRMTGSDVASLNVSLAKLADLIAAANAAQPASSLAA